MRTLIVYESMFGNTRSIAEAIADGLAPYSQVDLHEVGTAPAPLPAELDLLIVGAPTHAFGMSRPKTRQSARDETPAELVSPGIGVREWLAKLDSGVHLAPATAFDTKFGKPTWLPGSAARGIAKHLKGLGHTLAAMPASFYVTGVTGPLADGEAARARDWGRTIGQTRTEAAQQRTNSPG